MQITLIVIMALGIFTAHILYGVIYFLKKPRLLFVPVILLGISSLIAGFLGTMLAPGFFIMFMTFLITLTFIAWRFYVIENNLD